MRRKLFTLAAGASAVLCIAAVVLWARGYWAYDEITWTRASNAGNRHYSWYLSIASGRGGLGVMMDAEIAYADSLSPAEAARPLDRWSGAKHLRAAGLPAAVRPAGRIDVWRVCRPVGIQPGDGGA